MEFDLSAWQVGVNVATTIGANFFTQWVRERRSRKKTSYKSTVTRSSNNVELEINVGKDIRYYKIIVKVGESTKNESKSENGICFSISTKLVHLP